MEYASAAANNTLPPSCTARFASRGAQDTSPIIIVTTINPLTFTKTPSLRYENVMLGSEGETLQNRQVFKGLSMNKDVVI